MPLWEPLMELQHMQGGGLNAEQTGAAVEVFWLAYTPAASPVATRAAYFDQLTCQQQRRDSDLLASFGCRDDLGQLTENTAQSLWCSLLCQETKLEVL